MIVAGIDIGSSTTKAVVLENEKVIGYFITPTGVNFTGAGQQALEAALDKVGIGVGDLGNIVVTGYGRKSSLNIPFVKRTVTEITCHAIGAYWLFPEARTIIDIGGQDSKFIIIGENGKIINFILNDKCAAGTGRFLEVMARALSLDISEIGPISLNSTKPCNISSTCVVFAETEIIGLLAEGKSVADILAGLHKAIALRIMAMAHMSWRGKVILSGGVAKNIGVKKALEAELQAEIYIPEEPQITGAIGAALTAKKRL